ncbi:Anaphase-promoting complex subunit 23 [Lunasporangiospora selenospora]|uniref:Anaphase-promoting complex subunit 23 n=1 Tax=Lunasporangiospora selenospora TaxID=979761 RepID=A0A9P6G3P9_9FUNG|nr:Anaphase-promoting complex subunit 23 [Lunasporangiospora selenospora]
MDAATWTALVRSLPEEEIRVALRQAIRACNERGLYFSARWAAETLNGLPMNIAKVDGDRESGTSRSISLTTTRWSDSLEIISLLDPQSANDLETDIYLMAKTFFDLKEFDRAAATLEQCSSNKSRFLRLYSKYLASAAYQLKLLSICAGEKRREQDTREVLGSRDNSSAENKELDRIEAELSEKYHEGTLDSFCKYLYGLVLLRRQRKNQAVTVLIESATVMIRELPVNFMTAFMLSHVSNEHFNRQEDILDMLDDLAEVFPASPFLMAERALALFNGGDHPESIDIFEGLVKDHPYRLDSMDIYSNVLFVTENRTKLSELARRCAMTDIHRPETCCIIGNYYSMKGEHKKAVVYFKKALRLNRGYSAAWTLLGHEYLEMKSTYAAVEAYRRAVDYNHKDYRAWNGLGQAYEVLKMHCYALTYYQRATSLKPYDGRMWCAMAECYEFLDQDTAAIQCYTRALSVSSQEKMALIKLPKLYKKIGDTAKAVYYFRKSLDHLRENQIDSEDTSEACLFLAEYEREEGNLIAASDYATEALRCSSEQHQEDAKALLRDIRSVQESRDMDEAE